MIYRNPNSGDIGAASEMIVVADLMLAGFQVFRAVGANASFDLVAVDGDGEMYKVEVKTNRNPHSLGIYARAKADIIATTRTAAPFNIVEYRRLPLMEPLTAKGGQWREQKETDRKIDIENHTGAARAL